MAKLFKSLLVVVLLILVAGGFFIWYAAPSEELDLSYEPVPFVERALDMLRRQSLELVLTVDDLNHLAKRALASHAEVHSDITVTGASFSLLDDRMIAKVNVMYRDLVPLGLTLNYRFEWQEPYWIGTVTAASLKGVKLPVSPFDEVRIPLGEQLPAPVRIENVQIDQETIKVRFRKPDLADLAELLG